MWTVLLCSPSSRHGRMMHSRKNKSRSSSSRAQGSRGRARRERFLAYFTAYSFVTTYTRARLPACRYVRTVQVTITLGTRWDGQIQQIVESPPFAVRLAPPLAEIVAASIHGYRVMDAASIVPHLAASRVLSRLRGCWKSRSRKPGALQNQSPLPIKQL